MARDFYAAVATLTFAGIMLDPERTIKFLISFGFTGLLIGLFVGVIFWGIAKIVGWVRDMIGEAICLVLNTYFRISDRLRGLPR